MQETNYMNKYNTKSKSNFKKSNQKIKSKELKVLCKQMSILLKSGCEITRILNILYEQSNKKFNYILAQVLRMTQENLNLEDFKDALFDIFEEENIKRALEIIDKKSSLINLEFANEYKNILNLFDSKNKKYI